ncbi:MAG TPA: hypothetical protein VHV32_00955 [Candidatus Angelobacter sp.]|jgi:hypothetical protein|nr:hypothetical protein [Candidatus Angelobacter sp.]
MTNEDYKSLLAHVLAQFESDAAVSCEQIREWMHSSSLEVRWLAADLMLQHPDRVIGLSNQERDTLILKHLVQEIFAGRSDPKLPGSYLAGHSLRAWFERLWQHRSENEEVLRQLRTELADIAINGSERARDAVITAVLEHLFSQSSIVHFFSLWRDDKRLAAVYDEALRLSQSIG